MVVAAAAAPALTLTEWLCAELDEKLASLPTDQARYRELILQGNVWTASYDKFRAFGTMPFDGPHPVYGHMTAFDFILLLTDIESRKTRLIRERVPYHALPAADTPVEEAHRQIHERAHAFEIFAPEQEPT